MSTRYLLDTHICRHIVQNKSAALRQRFSRHSSRELAMSVITLGELRFAGETSQCRERALASIDQLEQLIPIYALPEAAAEHYGQIRAALQQQGQVIGDNDMWLAAHARAEGWILVTSDERGFRHIANLQVENWGNIGD